MPVENLEEEGLPKNPKLELAQLKFHLETPKHKNDEAAKSTIMEAIKTDSKIALLGFVNFDLSPLKQSWISLFTFVCHCQCSFSSVKMKQKGWV